MMTHARKVQKLTKRYINPIGFLIALAILAGCASTKVTQETPISDVGLARPNMIWVYNFVSAPSDVPSDSSLNGQFDPASPPPSPEDAATAQKYGAVIAEKLVEDIQNMGMPATNAVMGSQPQIGDGVIRGYITSTEGGGAGGLAKRMIIGFGSGQAEISTVVEGYVMTANGPQWLGSGSVNAEGNKAPGLIVPAAIAAATANPVGLIVVGGLKIAGAATGRSGLEGRAKSTADEIAAQLKIRFQQRGWITAESSKAIRPATPPTVTRAVAMLPSKVHARISQTLARRVDHAMMADPRLRNVRCEYSRRGAIALSGTVFDENDRQLAEATASRVRGVRRVVNDVKTETEEWAQEQRLINQALAANGIPLSVLVIGPKAYLSGEVVGDSEQARAFTVINSVSRLEVVNFSRVVPGRVF